jgi:hypothetical protein
MKPARPGSELQARLRGGSTRRNAEAVNRLDLTETETEFKELIT